MVAIAVFGGSFDPVHNGHLRMALELQENLAFDQVRLLPAYRSPLKSGTQASPAQRLAMLELALANCPGIGLDAREIEAGQATYSIDSLQQIRDQLGATASITWVMGSDALQQFDRWHRWQDFLSLVNIAVLARPGAALPQSGVLADWLVQHQVAATDLPQRAAGGVAVVQQRLLPISATEIRTTIAQGRSAQFLLPEPVWDYICKYELYR